MRAFTLAVPRALERQGPHSDVATGPALPALPRWICAAAALPVRLRNVSRHETVPPVPLRVSPAAKVPPALALTPSGFGISFPALSVAVNAIAWSALDQRALPIPDHKPIANTAAMTAPTPSFRRFMRASR